MQVIDTWNSLPSNVVLAPSVDSFKSRLNKHWHGHPLKFEASCYVLGVQQTIVTQEEMHCYRVVYFRRRITVRFLTWSQTPKDRFSDVALLF